MIPGKKYDPGTFTSRRPTPEKFAHLRSWVEPFQRDIKITNISEMTNINQQLEQTAQLFISNLISRVIAQIIGKCGDGFVTIEGTAEGYLKVENQEVITVKKAVINVATAATHTIVAAVAGMKIQVRTIALTVGGEVNLTWLSAAVPISGAMDFGGASEPRGMCPNLGKYPLETTVSEALQLTLSAAIQVSGWITYTEAA